MSRKFSALLVATFLSLSTAAFADDLDNATAKAIMSACGGSLFGDDSGAIATFVRENLSFCKEVREKGADLDMGDALRRYRVPLTQKDLERIFHPDYLRPRDLSEIERECTYNEPGGPVGVDRKCVAVRQMLADSDAAVSLVEYQAAERRCDGHHECIDNWARAQVKGSGAGQGLTLDDLMSESQLDGKDDLFDTVHDTPSAMGEADTGFDDIFAARDRLRVADLKQDLFDSGEQIASRCQCAFQRSSCFAEQSFSYSQLNDAMADADVGYEERMDEVCGTWMSEVRGRTSDDEQVLNQLLGNSRTILANLSSLDQGYADVIAQLNSNEYEITARIEAEREAEQQAKSGFNWGKFTGLATGTLIGASMGDLTGADTVELLGRAALDSMQGVEGVDNFDQGIEEITDTHLESIEAMNEIRAQTQAMQQARADARSGSTAVHGVSSPAGSYDDLLASSEAASDPTDDLLGSGSPGPRKGGDYGAIAFAMSDTSDAAGFAVGYVSADDARQAALTDCGTDCGVARVFQSCGAIVIGRSQGNPRLSKYHFKANTLGIAEGEPYGACSRLDKHDECRVVASGCNPGY